MFLVDLDLSRYYISLDSLDHMLVLALLHQLEVACLLDLLHLRFGLQDAITLVVDLVFNQVLLCLLLFELPLDFLELQLFSLYLATSQVVLLSQLAHRYRNFFDFFAAAFPTGDHIVWLEQSSCRHEG